MNSSIFASETNPLGAAQYGRRRHSFYWGAIWASLWLLGFVINAHNSQPFLAFVSIIMFVISVAFTAAKSGRPPISRTPTIPPSDIDLAYNRAGDSPRRAAQDAHRRGENASSWISGAEGEELFAKTFSQLSNTGWVALHSLPASLAGTTESDIDHLIIGPGGIFTVNTKHLRHPIVAAGHDCWVNEVPSTYLSDASLEARKATERLFNALERDILVHPMIVATRGGIERQSPSHVILLDITELVSWLAALPTVMTNADIATVHTASRNLTTWRRHY